MQYRLSTRLFFLLLLLVSLAVAVPLASAQEESSTGLQAPSSSADSPTPPVEVSSTGSVATSDTSTAAPPESSTADQDSTAPPAAEDSSSGADAPDAESSSADGTPTGPGSDDSLSSTSPNTDPEPDISTGDAGTGPNAGPIVPTDPTDPTDSTGDAGSISDDSSSSTGRVGGGATDDSSSSSSFPVWAIAVIAVGGVAIVTALVAIVCVRHHRKQRRDADPGRQVDERMRKVIKQNRKEAQAGGLPSNTIISQMAQEDLEAQQQQQGVGRVGGASATAASLYAPHPANSGNGYGKAGTVAAGATALSNGAAQRKHSGDSLGPVRVQYEARPHDFTPQAGSSATPAIDTPTDQGIKSPSAFTSPQLQAKGPQRSGSGVPVRGVEMQPIIPSSLQPHVVNFHEPATAIAASAATVSPPQLSVEDERSEVSQHQPSLLKVLDPTAPPTNYEYTLASTLRPTDAPNVNAASPPRGTAQRPSVSRSRSRISMQRRLSKEAAAGFDDANQQPAEQMEYTYEYDYEE